MKPLDVTPDSLKSALLRWQVLLGPAGVLVDDDILRRYATATYETSNRVCAVLRPLDRKQVQVIVRIANETRVPLYPISSGKNWGYGSAVPTADHCAILDLSGMNRILKLDAILGTVTLEPGVTQQQLYDYLQAENAPFWIDATGASAQCSIIGNTLERGFGHTPYGDHFAHVSGLEVILPTGEVFNTGFNRYPNAQAADVYHWGVGPYLDGLFSQSNLGIVTRMTIWLMPKPDYCQAFFCGVSKEDFASLVDALRPLRLAGTLKSSIHLVNADKAISAFGQYPWKEVGDITPLPRDWLAKASKASKVSDWNASGALYGTRAEVALARKKLKRALRGIRSSKLQFLDHRLIRFATMFQKPLSWLTGQNIGKALTLGVSLYNLKQGIPTNAFVPSTYWRKKHPAPPADQADPDRDRCGLLWLAPIAPMTGEHARILDDLIEDTLLRYGFEPSISMTLITPRCIDSVISITYDRDDALEEQRALQCHDELLGELTDRGYYPYRLSTRAMGRLPKPEPGYQLLIDRIKAALDPNHILAPGRYEEKN
ncbi:MAG: 4-cresol dehydrogenase (hydroxylating) [Motiliproteus sp.]|jgi:4-cresol dehydrogenase (hydroxylating)